MYFEDLKNWDCFLQPNSGRGNIFIKVDLAFILRDSPGMQPNALAYEVGSKESDNIWTVHFDGGDKVYPTHMPSSWFEDFYFHYKYLGDHALIEWALS
jgi:hypothetical protein